MNLKMFHHLRAGLRSTTAMTTTSTSTKTHTIVDQTSMDFLVLSLVSFSTTDSPDDPCGWIPFLLILDGSTSLSERVFGIGSCSIDSPPSITFAAKRKRGDAEIRKMDKQAQHTYEREISEDRTFKEIYPLVRVCWAAVVILPTNNYSIRRIGEHLPSRMIVSFCFCSTELGKAGREGGYVTTASSLRTEGIMLFSSFRRRS